MNIPRSLEPADYDAAAEEKLALENAEPQQAEKDQDLNDDEDLDDEDEDDEDDDADVATDEDGNEMLKRGGLPISATGYKFSGPSANDDEPEAEPDVDADRVDSAQNVDSDVAPEQAKEGPIDIKDIDKLEDDAKGG